jgi:predicted nuclease with TOPRIM domain
VNTLKSAKIDLEKENASLNRERRELSEENHRLKQESTQLQEDLKKQSREVESYMNEVESVRSEFNGLSHDAFCNCLQQVLLLNLGVVLNFKGIIPDHVVLEDVLTNVSFEK